MPAEEVNGIAPTAEENFRRRDVVVLNLLKYGREPWSSDARCEALISLKRRLQR